MVSILAALYGHVIKHASVTISRCWVRALIWKITCHPNLLPLTLLAMPGVELESFT